MSSCGHLAIINSGFKQGELWQYFHMTFTVEEKSQQHLNYLWGTETSETINVSTPGKKP